MIGTRPRRANEGKRVCFCALRGPSPAAGNFIIKSGSNADQSSASSYRYMSQRSFPTLHHLADKAPREPVRVLMVCMGNICRSPTAHGVLEHMAACAARAVAVDSAGTHGYHEGAPPDTRALAHAARRGYDLSRQRARRLRAQDFTAFDLVLVMDEANEAAAHALCPPAERHRLYRLTDFCRTLAVREVPDPYYGNAQGFERVLDIVEDACAGLLSCIAASVRKAAAH